MKSIALAITLALVSTVSAAAGSSARSVLGPYPPALATDTQFTLLQNLYVETITCKSWFVHYDLNQYGEIDGTGCAITGDLPADIDGRLGHVGVHFDIGGTVVDLASCRVDSTAANPGWAQYTIDCT